MHDPDKPSREAKPSLVAVDAENFDRLPCCGIKNPDHCGRQEKRRWFLANAATGLRIKMLLAPDGEPAGTIEYVPGEQAWRGIEATGYIVIHCVWIFAKRHQHKGWGRLLVEGCLEDAKAAGKAGVAVVVRDGPWSADRRLFEALGFRSVATTPPDFALLVKTFDDGALVPAFKGDWERKLQRYRRGLTILRSSQCPHIAKFAADIAAAAVQEFGVTPKIVDIESAKQAQDAPTPYAVFAVIADGHLLADHQISRARFRNIMKKIAPKTAPKRTGQG